VSSAEARFFINNFIAVHRGASLRLRIPSLEATSSHSRCGLLFKNEVVNLLGANQWAAEFVQKAQPRAGNPISSSPPSTCSGCVTPMYQPRRARLAGCGVVIRRFVARARDDFRFAISSRTTGTRALGTSIVVFSRADRISLAASSSVCDS